LLMEVLGAVIATYALRRAGESAQPSRTTGFAPLNPVEPQADMSAPMPFPASSTAPGHHGA
jgi:hypothetical protein